MVNIGERFERLIVVEKIKVGRYIKYRCVCDCGNERLNASFDLRSGKVKSCGCLSRERATKHGKSASRVYKIWDDMRKRCQNPKATGYNYYGARGIKVCKPWQKFENFYKDMGDPPTDKHTIDRINTDGDYKPSNCRWATRSEQQQNRRPFVQWNQKVTDEMARDIKFSSTDGRKLAKKYDISEQTVSKIRKGLSHKHITEER